MENTDYRDKFINKCMKCFKGNSMKLDEDTELKMKQFGRVILDQMLNVIDCMVDDGNMDDYMSEYYDYVCRMIKGDYDE